MTLPDFEERVQQAAKGWMDDAERLRNNWIRHYAESKGLTEMEFLRMVVEFDIKAGGSGNLELTREWAEQKYRDWFKLTDNLHK